MGVGQRAGVNAAGDQPREMGHVDEQPRANLVGDPAERGEIDDARIGRAAGDDDAGPALGRQPGHLVHVDPGVLGADAVLHRIEPLARQVGRRAVGQMPAGGERQAEDGVAGLAEREIDRRVGLGAGMRLHVREAAIEQRPGPLDGQRLGDVDELAPAVVAAARIAFRVFVGQHRAGGFQYRARDDVLGCDQLDLILLARQLRLHRRVQLGVGVADRVFEETVLEIGIRAESFY